MGEWVGNQNGIKYGINHPNMTFDFFYSCSCLQFKMDSSYSDKSLFADLGKRTTVGSMLSLSPVSSVVLFSWSYLSSFSWIRLCNRFLNFMMMERLRFLWDFYVIHFNIFFTIEIYQSGCPDQSIPAQTWGCLVGLSVGKKKENHTEFEKYISSTI